MPTIRAAGSLNFSDVLMLPKRSTIKSRSDIDLICRYKFRSSKQQYAGIPIIASNMDSVGTFEMAIALNEHNLLTTVHKHYSPDQWFEFANGLKDKKVLQNVAISTGISIEEQEKVYAILEKIPEINFICIDVANGYMESFVETIGSIRSRHPDKTIIAGNVVTSEMVEALILAGADIIKVGIGPGSVCTTRKKTGFGRGQLTAVLECAEAAHRLGGHVISDGGCTVPGDICKAFGAGADFVMLGGMLAGHDQCGGESHVDEAGNEYKLFYGMASKLAQEKHNAGLANYRASEGKVIRVPSRGNVADTILDILGSLRSSCAYAGTYELCNLSRNLEFERTSFQTNEVFANLEVKM